MAASPDTPQFAVPTEHLIPANNFPAQRQSIPESRMFLIRNALAAYKEKHGADAPTYNASQGDGGASLPGVPKEILERALQLQIENGSGYTKPGGVDRFRVAAAENYWQLASASAWGPDNIVFTQGGRDALLKAYNAMIALGHQQVGDFLVVTRVPWLSYGWGSYGVGLNLLRAPGRADDGWRYTPESIKACAEFAREHGRNVAGIIITSPDNPTGRTIPVEEQIELAHAALEAGYPFVIFDWIYHWVTDGGPTDINIALQAFAPEQRDRLIFIDGLTKSLGGSNIRSAHIVASQAVAEHATTSASHGIYPSFFAQAVAIAAYEMGFQKASAGIVEPAKQSRQILRETLAAENIRHIMGDGYYAFLDVTRYVEAGNFTDSEGLLAYLAGNYGVAVVPGSYFSGASANWIRFSYALPPEKTTLALHQLFTGLKSLL